MKKVISFLLVLSLILSLTASALADAPFRAWNKEDSYQYVQFGVYPQTTVDHKELGEDGKEHNVWADDPLIWLVLDTFEDEGVAFLLTEYVLDAYHVLEGADKKYARYIENYEDSDLFAWMNGEMVDHMLTAEEQSALDDSRGKLFLMTNEEYIDRYGWPKYIDDKHSAARMCDCTAYALERGVYHGPYKGGWGATFWCNRLRGGKGNQRMQIVGFDGHQSWAGVTRTNVGVRPSIRIRMSDVAFVSGSGTKNDPYVAVAVTKEN